jgi:hypothetical protein
MARHFEIFTDAPASPGSGSLTGRQKSLPSQQPMTARKLRPGQSAGCVKSERRLSWQTVPPAHPGPEKDSHKCGQGG